MTEGIDYAWGRTGPAAIKAAGKEFVIRYLSHDLTGKALTLTEAVQLTNAGLWLAVVFEDNAGRMLNGKATGAADATFAVRQAADCGMPSSRPIYFACDTEITTASQMSAVMAYLDGVASVIGLDRTGLYGQYSVIKKAFDLKKITFGWQTYAWSGGLWDLRAQLQQYKNEVILNGVDVDLCRSTTSDYGQWKIGSTPDMTITAAEIDKIVLALLNRDDVIPAPDGDPKNPYWTLKNILYDIAKNTRDVQASMTGLGVQDPDAIVRVISTALIAEITSPGMIDRITAAVVNKMPAPVSADALADAVTSKVLDGLARRMES